MGREAIPVPPALGLAAEITKLPPTTIDFATYVLWALFGFGVLLLLKQVGTEWYFDREERKEERAIEKEEKKELREIDREERRGRWAHNKYKLEAEIAKLEAERQAQERREVREFELTKLRLKYGNRPETAQEEEG